MDRSCHDVPIDDPEKILDVDEVDDRREEEDDKQVEIGLLRSFWRISESLQKMFESISFVHFKLSPSVFLKLSGGTPSYNLQVNKCQVRQ